MQRVKQFFGKEGGREYKHYAYSLSPEESRTATREQVRDNALRIIRETPELKGHQALVVVHEDKDNLHAHIIINSVNHENGKKLNLPKKVLDRMKKRCNEISIEQDLVVPEKSDEITTWNKYEKELIERGESWKLDIAKAITKALQTAKSRQEFEELLNWEGVGIKYLKNDNRKNVTYFDAEGHQVRDVKLEGTFKVPFGKERIDYEIRRNNQDVGSAGTHNVGAVGIIAKAVDGLSASDRKTDGEDYGTRIANQQADLSASTTGRVNIEAERRNAEELRIKQEREKSERRKRENERNDKRTQIRTQDRGGRTR